MRQTFSVTIGCHGLHENARPNSGMYGMARIFQMCREFLGDKFEVVGSLEEAYDMVGVHPEDFTERLFPKEMAA